MFCCVAYVGIDVVVVLAATVSDVWFCNEQRFLRKLKLENVRIQQKDLIPHFI